MCRKLYGIIVFTSVHLPKSYRPSFIIERIGIEFEYTYQFQRSINYERRMWVRTDREFKAKIGGKYRRWNCYEMGNGFLLTVEWGRLVKTMQK